MSSEALIALLTIGGTLLLVLTGLLNFSVFVRQLRAAREQLETARRQLESAQQQPEIQLVQRAMTQTSDHLKILVERPYLRPYFYENKTWYYQESICEGGINRTGRFFFFALSTYNGHYHVLIIIIGNIALPSAEMLSIIVKERRFLGTSIYISFILIGTIISSPIR